MISPNPDAGEECDPGDAGEDAAAATLCSGCKVLCNLGTGNLPFKDSVSHHCYFSYANAAELDAAGACEANGAHLARFVSEGEVSCVASVAGTTYWVGLDDSKPGIADWSPAE